tara:strand:+ start:426 stop:776 length:351 start_codon:yes stop_codon:yes gene_type:complete
MCPNGKYSAAVANSCINCPTGKYSSGAVEGNVGTYHADSCTVTPAGGVSGLGWDHYNFCGKGTYSSAGSENCADCPGGKFLADDTDTLASHDQPEDCVSCAAGKRSEDTEGESRKR